MFEILCFIYFLGSFRKFRQLVLHDEKYIRIRIEDKKIKSQSSKCENLGTGFKVPIIRTGGKELGLKENLTLTSMIKPILRQQSLLLGYFHVHTCLLLYGLLHTSIQWI